jgi:hypothetical protein
LVTRFRGAAAEARLAPVGASMSKTTPLVMEAIVRDKADRLFG